jgi:hypothetical protein
MARPKKETQTETETKIQEHDLSEVDRRLEMAFVYKKIVQTFSSEHDTVTEEIKVYAKLRLEQLLGIKTESTDTFSGSEQEVLKKLASAAIRKYSEPTNASQVVSVFSSNPVSEPTLNEKTQAILQKPVAKIPKSGTMVSGQRMSPGMLPMPRGVSAASIMTQQAAEQVELNNSFNNQMANEQLKKG